MAEFNLDLDALAPKVEHVKLNEEVIEVHPPKFKAIVELLRVQAEWFNIKDNAKAMETVDLLRAKISDLVPRLKDDDFDITIEQLNALMTFIFSMANPDALAQAKAKATGESIVETEATDAEKKTA